MLLSGRLTIDGNTPAREQHSDNGDQKENLGFHGKIVSQATGRCKIKVPAEKAPPVFQVFSETPVIFHFPARGSPA
jgi:hypothetical protein